MIFKKPKFWDYRKPNFISLVLLPFTIILIINNILTNIFLKKNNPKIKSICVGNIYVGGTGKTPFTIKIYQILKSLGYNVCVGKKFYNSQKDEQILLKNKTNLIFDKNRNKIIERSIRENNDIVIFDDGLQEKRIDYNLKFVCFDNINWIGNGLLIPAGPLRETIKSLKKFDAVIFKKIEENTDQEKIINQIRNINSNIQIFYSEYFPTNLKDFDLSKKYLIFSGIGNPNSFKRLLIKNNFNIIDEIIYPDHFNYRTRDIENIKKKANDLNAKIITTEKDFVKILEKDRSNIDYIEISLKIHNEESLKNFIISKINEKN